MSLSKPQRHVALGMAAGLLFSIAALVATASLQVFDHRRLALAPLAALAPALMLAFCIARLAAHRFLTPEDIDGSALTAGSGRARLLQALLQNTLEQAVLAIPVYAAWSVVAPASLAGLVLTAALLFVTGRSLFFAGYQRGAAGRAFGFALTFYPTVILLACLFYWAIARA